MSRYSQQQGKRTSSLFMQDEWREEHHYHIIGKAIPGEVLFRDEDDCRWFLRRVLRDKLCLIFDIYVYCLCVNHFHLVIETYHADDIRALLMVKAFKKMSRSDELFLAGEESYKTHIYTALLGAISGYARHYNTKYKRVGQLFVKPTLHGLTDKGEPGKEFSRRMGSYVGLNYVKHNIAKANEMYPWSSLRATPYKIVDQNRLLEQYGGESAYIDYNANYLRKYGKAFHAFEEDNFFAALAPRRYNISKGEWEEGEWRPLKSFD